jgi:hypothetical protein
MPARKRKNAFGDIFRSRVTYHRDVGSERRQLQREAMDERRRQMQLKKIRAQELVAEAKIRAAERKIAAAEQKIEVAATKASRGASRGSGGISEAELERIKAHMESEIAKQEDVKRAALARIGNPSWGYGIYRGVGFGKEQIAHFKSRAAAETYARSHGLHGYQIQRAFAKNPRRTSMKRGERHTEKEIRDARSKLAAQRKWDAKHDVVSAAARIHMDRDYAHLPDDEYTKSSAYRQLKAAGRAGFTPSGHVNPSGTEFHLGYNLGQADRQSAQLRKTLDELHATFAANFPPESLASWESFETAYASGYSGQMGAVAPARTAAGNPRGQVNRGSSRNPETPDEEYEQAKRIAELFHGRPVKEEITVTESIREHDWLWRIGPLVKLKIRTLTKRSATLPFHQTEEGTVHLFCSPDGRQFYLRGGDQELDLKALGMGEGTEWYRDHMLIGEAKEITYRDKKKFHKFKLTDYFHKLGEVTKKKPMLAYNALAHKMEILGGQYKVETEDLVDGMSPGIVN